MIDKIQESHLAVRCPDLRPAHRRFAGKRSAVGRAGDCAGGDLLGPDRIRPLCFEGSAW